MNYIFIINSACYDCWPKNDLLLFNLLWPSSPSHLFSIYLSNKGVGLSVIKSCRALHHS